jgi:hypothetical protein
MRNQNGCQSTNFRDHKGEIVMLRRASNEFIGPSNDQITQLLCR